MIYLKNKSTPQVIFIPKHRERNGALIFSIKNTINLLPVQVDVLLDFKSAIYFKISVMLPAEMTVGEYEYTLSDDAGIISTGLLVVGELSKPNEYNKVIQYEQSE